MLHDQPQPENLIEMKPVRVRFAPSPTGTLHVGGLRTALFNYLFAKQQQGAFVLRIEDTDQERLVPGAEQGILEMLKWAGVEPDEDPRQGGPFGPYRQSERLALYHEAAARLIKAGHAYKCYTSPAELAEMRAQQQARGVPPKYDGRHRNLSPKEQQRFEEEGRKPVVRMRIPDRDERIVIDDVVRGRVAFNSSQLDDQVLLKSDGFPTYHLAVAVDDAAMGITHILRAEEWLPSTPKHILLYRWLGNELPVFAHLPLLLNDDRSKMSKRKGDVAAESYRDKGYLPWALINFLALLGWNPGTDQELFTLPELLQEFSLDRIGKAGAVFDREKLNWMNQHYIQALPPQELFEQLKSFIIKGPYGERDEALLKKIAAIVQPSLVRLSDIDQHLALFFRDAEQPLPNAWREIMGSVESKQVFQAFLEQLQGLPSLDREGFRKTMKAVQKQTGVKGKMLFQPMRLAITLDEQGPDLADVADVFGKEKIVQRLDQALRF